MVDWALEEILDGGQKLGLDVHTIVGERGVLHHKFLPKRRLMGEPHKFGAKKKLGVRATGGGPLWFWDMGHKG